MTTMRTNAKLLLGAVFLAVLGTAALAQVRQLQMGTAIDANPQVGTGGANQPVQGFVPINGNEIVSGNVAGLKYFHGPTATASPYQFGGASSNRSVIVGGAVVPPNSFGGTGLGSSALGGFARQSAGGPINGAANQGLNQIYYLPSATVSTGAGALRSAPIGAGFDSALVPTSAISPTAGNAQLNNMAASAAPAAINRVMPSTLMDASLPTGPLSTPMFSLRLPEVKEKPETPAIPGETAPEMPGEKGSDKLNPDRMNTPMQAPGGTVVSPGDNPPTDPNEVIGAVNAGRDTRITSKTDELKAAAVGDNYMKVAQELKIAQGLPLATEKTTREAPGSAVAMTTGTTGQEIDPLTGLPRKIAVLPKPGTTTEPALSPKGLTDLSTNELTAGQKIKPVRLGSTLSSSAPRSNFETLMTRGEENLKAGKYLDAAQTFQSALANKPDDPLALVGRSHAELGAGIYTAAAHDLKFVFTRKPGLISVKYESQSFIPAGRTESLLQDLQKLTGNKETADMGSFLYCYLCYQTGRDAALQTELKKWTAREGHDEWASVLARAWGTTK